MCSHRETEASFLFHSGLGRTGAAGLSGDFVIVERSGCNLRAPWQLNLGSRAVEIDFLVEQVVSTVFASTFDIDGILPGFDQLALVVLAVPLQVVVSGRPGGAGDGSGNVGSLRHGAQVVGAIPGAQFGQPAVALEPQGDGAHRELVAVFRPYFAAWVEDGDKFPVRAAIEP